MLFYNHFFGPQSAPGLKMQSFQIQGILLHEPGQDLAGQIFLPCLNLLTRDKLSQG